MNIHRYQCQEETAKSKSKKKEKKREHILIDLSMQFLNLKKDTIIKKESPCQYLQKKIDRGLTSSLFI